MKQILCLMILRGIKYSSAINQALLSRGGQEEEAGTQSIKRWMGHYQESLGLLSMFHHPFYHWIFMGGSISRKDN